MLCEKYKPALIEAATTGAKPAPAVRAHADSCASCAAALAQQRQLVAAIDASLHRQMNAPVPAAMLQRIEAHIAQQPQPKRTPRFAQIFAGAVATLAIAGVVLFIVPRHKPQVDNARQIVSQPKQNQEVDRMRLETASSPSQAEAPTTFRTRAPKRTQTHVISLSSATAASHTEPEVLVPPDDRIAFEHFIADFDGREALAAALTKRVPLQELRLAPLDVPDIQTASLTVSPVKESDAIANR